MVKSLSTSLVLRGLLALGIGAVALAWPGVTVLALVVVFAVYAFIAAGLQALQAFSSRTAGPVFGHLLLGLVDLAAGIVALAWPGPTALVLVLVVASWAIVSGTLEIFAAFRSGEEAGDACNVHPRWPRIGGLWCRALRPPRYGRHLSRSLVRPVQPGLGELDARTGHRASPGQRHPALPGRADEDEGSGLSGWPPVVGRARRAPSRRPPWTARLRTRSVTSDHC